MFFRLTISAAFLGAAIAAPATAQDELAEFLEKTAAEAVPEPAKPKEPVKPAEEKKTADTKPGKSEKKKATEKEKRVQDRRDRQRQSQRRNRRNNVSRDMSTNTRRLCPTC